MQTDLNSLNVEENIDFSKDFVESLSKIFFRD
jgi:hypothetical protein